MKMKNTDVGKIFIGGMTIVMFCMDCVLLFTFLVMRHKFKSLMTTQPAIQRLKQGAMQITLIISLSYIMSYIPIMGFYVVQLICPGITNGLEGYQKTLLDFLLMLCAHVYSCVVPFVLVMSGNLKKCRRVDVRSLKLVRGTVRGQRVGLGALN